jgi:phosphoglycolate phosphatase-like HAD superfamily hydrolase
VTDVVVAIVLLAAAAVPLVMLRDLRTVPPGPSGPSDAPSVSVVVPARDEEASLPGLLASLQQLAVRPADVVVVDDGSRDATAALAGAAGARVLAAGTPPPDWTGKAWACHLGASATSGELLLFLDADTTLAPTALASLLAAREERGGLVSVQPYHRTERAYEQLSSYFNAVAVLASGAFAAGGPRGSIAFGPCLLTSRVDYLAAGGHEAVRGEVLDDASLGAAYSRAGLPVWCAVGDGSVSMRSYPGGWRQLVAGWTKNFASGAAAADRLAALASVLWISAHHAIAVGAVLSVAGWATGSGGTLVAGSWALWLAAWVVAAWQLRRLLRRIGSFRWWTWALFPIPLLAFDLVFARSALLTVVRRSVRWRGREVDLRRSTNGAA